MATTPIKTIGDKRRPQLENEALGGYRTTKSKEYSKTHPFFFNAEGINGDNRGKEPTQAPTTPQEALSMIGSAADIKARIGPNSLGAIVKNSYIAGKEYKAEW